MEGPAERGAGALAAAQAWQGPVLPLKVNAASLGFLWTRRMGGEPQGGANAGSLGKVGSMAQPSERQGIRVPKPQTQARREEAPLRSSRLAAGAPEGQHVRPDVSCG